MDQDESLRRYGLQPSADALEEIRGILRPSAAVAVRRQRKPYFGTLANGYLMLEDPEVVIHGDGAGNRMPEDRAIRSMATMLDDAGLSPWAVADHLGHARPSMTQDVVPVAEGAQPARGEGG